MVGFYFCCPFRCCCRSGRRAGGFNLCKLKNNNQPWSSTKLSLSVLSVGKDRCVSVYLLEAPWGPTRGHPEDPREDDKKFAQHTVAARRFVLSFAVTRVYHHRITCSNLHNVCTRPQRLTGLARSTCAVEWQDRTRILELFPIAVARQFHGKRWDYIHTTLLVLVGWICLPHELLIEEKDTFVLIPCTIPLKNTSITHRFFFSRSTHVFFHFPSLNQQRRRHGPLLRDPESIWETHAHGPCRCRQWTVVVPHTQREREQRTSPVHRCEPRET